MPVHDHVAYHHHTQKNEWNYPYGELAVYHGGRADYQLDIPFGRDGERYFHQTQRILIGVLLMSVSLLAICGVQEAKTK